MAAHNFSEAQMAYIETTIGIKADELQNNFREISTNVQIAFEISQKKVEALFNEAHANATRVDSQVHLVNELNASIELKIVDQETAIVASGQSADGAHARFSALLVDLKGFSGSWRHHPQGGHRRVREVP